MGKALYKANVSLYSITLSSASVLAAKDALERRRHCAYDSGPTSAANASHNP
jgi:hypothetical protein